MELSYADRNAGAKNLILNCAEMTTGMSLLIIHEEFELGYYGRGIVEDVEKTARELNLVVECLEVPFNPVVTDPGPELSATMNRFDRVLFLARLGDQIRFRPSGGENYSIMSYALDQDMLGSRFGIADYNAFVTLKDLTNDALSNAQEIHVTCPAGTDFRGPGAVFPKENAETTVKRFPLSVFTPVPNEGFSGRVAQRGFLCGTGSQVYDPPACEIKDTLFIHFEDNRIIRFEGSDADVASAERHYHHVANLFDLDWNWIHSWHAGIHPGCAYTQPASQYIDRWANGAFGNPRILHFHTCGRYPPGEICWNILDPTVTLDGVPVWEKGRLHPDRISGGRELLDNDPFLHDLFAAPSQECGLGPSGGLEY
jgi:hypothetical protein